jgi:hypothetical protein
VEQVELTAENGRVLTLRRISSPNEDSIWRYEATLRVDGGQMTTVVLDLGTGLRDLFTGLAEAWKGFDGTRSFGSLEGQLTIEARHDGLGTVRCDVHLRQPSPPEWDLSATLDFGAGAQLGQLAKDLDRFTP